MGCFGTVQFFPENVFQSEGPPSIALIGLQLQKFVRARKSYFGLFNVQFIQEDCRRLPPVTVPESLLQQTDRRQYPALHRYFKN